MCCDFTLTSLTSRSALLISMNYAKKIFYRFSIAIGRWTERWFASLCDDPCLAHIEQDCKYILAAVCTCVKLPDVLTWYCQIEMSEVVVRVAAWLNRVSHAGLLSNVVNVVWTVSSGTATASHQLVVPSELMWPSGVLCTWSETVILFVAWH